MVLWRTSRLADCVASDLILTTRVFLFDFISEEFFYQLGLRQFGDYHRIKLDPAPPLRSLVKLAVDAEEGADNSSLDKVQIVNVGIVFVYRGTAVD